MQRKNGERNSTLARMVHTRRRESCTTMAMTTITMTTSSNRERSSSTDMRSHRRLGRALLDRSVKHIFGIYIRSSSIRTIAHTWPVVIIYSAYLPLSYLYKKLSPTHKSKPVSEVITQSTCTYVDYILDNLI